LVWLTNSGAYLVELVKEARRCRRLLRFVRRRPSVRAGRSRGGGRGDRYREEWRAAGSAGAADRARRGAEAGQCDADPSYRRDFDAPDAAIEALFRGAAVAAIGANGFLELPILPIDAEAAGALA